MEKVYLVYVDYGYDGDTPEGICSSEQNALALVQSLTDERGYVPYPFRIKAFIIDTNDEGTIIGEDESCQTI